LILFHALWRFEPTPVVALNSAVAWAQTGQHVQALAQVERLGEALSDYQPFHAVHADLLAKNGLNARAARAYQLAIEHAPTPGDALFLSKRLQAVLP
jgi:predicted RNA polymerase sigma factor